MTNNQHKKSPTDGDIFSAAVAKSKETDVEIMQRMKRPNGRTIANGTFYNLKKKAVFGPKEREMAAAAFNTTVKEMFGDNGDENGEDYTSEESTGELKMSSDKEVIEFGKQAHSRLSPDDYANAFKGWAGVPMYNVPVTASFVQTYRDNNVMNPQYYLHDPRFKDCSFGAIITGDSMYPEIRHGDFVVCQEITDKRFIVFGDIYYVVSSNGLETCKYINKDPEDRSNYLLVPRNSSIDPSPIPKEMIERLFKVRGVVRGY